MYAVAYSTTSLQVKLKQQVTLFLLQIKIMLDSNKHLTNSLLQLLQSNLKLYARKGMREIKTTKLLIFNNLRGNVRKINYQSTFCFPSD
jgi:hypothetical protein